MNPINGATPTASAAQRPKPWRSKCSYITALGQKTQGATTDLAIGSVTVGGRVEFADILGGFDVNLHPLNGDAQIGAVKVGGNWIASSVATGAFNMDLPSFGDGLDTSTGAGTPGITASIASITIGGNVFGTPTTVSTFDHFGFVAQKILAFKAGGVTFNLQPLALDSINLGTTNDVTLHEI